MDNSKDEPIVDKGDNPMNKDGLFKKIQTASRGNLFSIEVPKATTEEDENKIEEWVKELEREGKIKLRKCIQREYSVYLHGLIKYASE
jgi:hypothetical protein